MKRTFLAAILATAAIAFSCTMEEPAQSSSVVMNPTATIENFVMDGPLTKLQFSLDDNVASYAFENEDVLRAYPVAPEIGAAVRFTVKEKKDTKCVFTGAGFGLIEGQKYAAYYPGGSNEVPAVDEVPVSFLGQSQPAANEWNLSNADFLYATGIEAENRACSFVMHHLGALLVMDITFTEAGTYKELALKSTMPFITEGTVDLTADEIELDPEETSDTITLALGGDNGMAVTANQTVRFYMMVAPVDMSNATMTLTLTDVNNNTIVKEGPGSNFEAGKAVAFGATPAAPVVPAVNLSAEETANTYIVSAAGDYYFDCTVAGNGVASLPAGILGAVGLASAYPSPNNTAALTAGKSVDVVLNQNNCIKDVTIADGYIFFTATGAEGNAKIHMKDAGGQGVWVWTIWCTDQPQSIALDNGYEILDRNIGATTAEPGNTEAEYGLYYMFGDPIGYTSANFDNAGADNASMIWELAYSPSQPLLGAGCWFNIWGATNNPKQVGAFLWGAWGTGAAETWAPSFDKQPGTSSFKVLYDPCPVGYKVMAYDVLPGSVQLTADMTGVYFPAAEGTVYFPYNGMVHNGYEYDWAFHGPYDPSEPDGFAWYAAVWTSAFNNSNMAYCRWAYAKDSNRGYIEPLKDSIMSRGMGVRCMKE